MKEEMHETRLIGSRDVDGSEKDTGWQHSCSRVQIRDVHQKARQIQSHFYSYVQCS